MTGSWVGGFSKKPFKKKKSSSLGFPVHPREETLQTQLGGIYSPRLAFPSSGCVPGKETWPPEPGGWFAGGRRIRLIAKSGLLRLKSRSGKLGSVDLPAPLDLLHDPLARIPRSGRRYPPSLLSSGWPMLRAGVLLVICSGTRQGTQRRCRRWGECAGVGSALLRTRILGPVTQGCIPGESDGIEQENWEVLTRPGARMKATVAPCHAGCAGKAEPNPNPKQVLTQKGNGEETTLSGGYPQPVLSPSPPTWSRTGSGSGSEHTHLCPLLSERQQVE